MMRSLAVAGCLAALANVAFPAGIPVPEKKFIECSWTTPTPAYVRENIREMERRAPYDGIRIRLEAEGEYQGEKVICEPFRILSGIRWRYEWFESAVADLKATEFRQFTDNFLDTGFQPGIRDWFDDAAWEAACANFGLMARIASETGMKGLVVDPEIYQEPMFRFAPGGNHSYEETVEQVRRRGRQWGEAVFGAYPAITLFFYYGWSYNLPAGRRSAGDALEALYGYPGLLVPFLNGVYDVLPPEAVFIDGHEDQSYQACSPEQFHRMHCDFSTRFVSLVAPENRNKFRAQTHLGPGIYLDAFFTNRPGDYWHLKPEASDRVTLFRNTLLWALDSTDRYVWSWGEQFRWWDFPYHGSMALHVQNHGTGDFWENRAPGITRAVRIAKRDPEAIAEYIAARACRNLVRNGDFTRPATAVEPVPEWSYWEDEAISRGSCRVDAEAGGVVWTHTGWGLLEQAVPVSEGHLYVLRLRADDRAAAGEPAALINWMDADRRFIRSDYNRSVLFGLPDTAGVREGLELVFPPPGAVYMRVLFGVWRQTESDGPIRFHSVEVYDLE
ncbi:hypothetical protein [Victivallis sp. Marseille-Q1083]|uniref:hypothetical protein n=1 Tax=Victivallis sp. Marseille-Q1083 TaxID=2717288 RepID=UPI00158D0956|nr:hypothetical protein [Victivallis sp. Marseille-Q1083]